MLSRNRFQSIYLLFVVFAAFSAVTRTVLLVNALPNLELGPVLLVKIYAVGLFYDCVTFSYAAVPFVLLVTLLPDRFFNSRPVRYLAYAVFFVVTYALIFDIASEHFFFDEFGTRFNFIAVDYLIYTTEVVRNIQESYPVYWICAAIFVVNLLILLALRRRIDKAFGHASSIGRRAGIGAALLLMPALSFAFVDLSFTDISPNNFADELAGNGLYNFAAAFRNSELDYDRFYTTEDDRIAMARLRGLLTEKNSRFVSDDVTDITRDITNPGPEKRLNLIVVVEESLSAEYLGVFGCDRGITPNLDRLADESLFFTHLYATGTRTVRGLEAIALSVPPLPGESIVKRPGNEGLFSWGTVMKEKGYDNKFIYAGYGYFDNMNYFFGNNGFKTVDRADFTDDEVTFSNAWGVCDEDLFGKVIAEGNKSYASKKPFFSVVMTTSNHRPYTYPEGRIDIPSHTGRDGAVKYCDYAIGRLVEELKKQPWAKDTVLVVVADHCAGSARKVALPVKKYEIPMFIYSPGNIAPRRVDTMMSQIDVAPTVLGLLNMSYRSRFIGRDALKSDGSSSRAFISTYQRLGYMDDDRLVIFDPMKKVEGFTFVRESGDVTPDGGLTDETADGLGYYQGTNYIYKRGLNKAL